MYLPVTRHLLETQAHFLQLKPHFWMICGLFGSASPPGSTPITTSLGFQLLLVAVVVMAGTTSAALMIFTFALLAHLTFKSVSIPSELRVSSHAPLFFEIVYDNKTTCAANDL